MNDMQRYIIAFVILKAITLAALVALFIIVLQGQNTSRIDACHDTRILISTIVLRGVGTDYATYRKDPARALAFYRQMLKGNAFYKKNPELIERSVEQTRNILVLSDPRLCQ